MKRKAQFDQGDITGQNLLEILQIKEPQDVFIRLSESFSIVGWNIRPFEGGLCAHADFCALNSQAKAIGAPRPCHPYCLDAIAEMLEALVPDTLINVHETLWDGERCRVEVRFANLLPAPYDSYGHYLDERKYK